MNEVLHFSAFHLCERCGEGDDGVVWKAVRRADALCCAMKIMRAPLIELIPKEASILSTLNEQDHHPNLVKYHGWGRVARREMIAAGCEKMCCFTGEVGAFIVMEWVEGETLENKISQSSFGRNKRRHVCKQLLEAVHYMHAIGISHGGLFLNNMMISRSKACTSTLPRLVICDFGSACCLPALSEAQKEIRMDKDRCQCGGVILALFSSANLNNQVNTNRLMAKDALRLAKDLIDLRKIVSLDAALQTPFLTDDMPEDRFTITSTSQWNDEIMANIVDHIISTGDLKDFSSASLVCKQFFVTLQRRFLCTSQFPHLSKLPDSCSYPDSPPAATVEECCLWLESVPYNQDWERLHNHSGCDLAFEAEVLDCFFQSVSEQTTRAQHLINSFSNTNDTQRDIYLYFHDMQKSGFYVGQSAILLLGRNAKARMNPWRGTTPFVCNIEDEKKLLIRILEKIRECTMKLSKEAKEYARRHGFIVQGFS